MARLDKSPKEPGANRKALLQAMEALKHPRVDVKDPRAIEERIAEYLQYCVEQDVAPSAAACASWLGVSVSTIQSWYAGTSATPEHQAVAARFYLILQDVWSQNMQENNINPVSGIFMGKVFFGYKDTQDIVVNHTLQNEMSAADLIAESRMLPGGDNLIIDAEAKVIEEKQPQNTMELPALQIAYERLQNAQKAKAAQKEEPKKKLKLTLTGKN